MPLFPFIYSILGCFDPSKSVHRPESMELQISVLSGRHLAAGKSIKSDGGKAVSAADAFVKLEIFGCPPDCSYGSTAIVQVRSEENYCFAFEELNIKAAKISSSLRSSRAVLIALGSQCSTDVYAKCSASPTPLH